jgi:predicted dinucleotide-utilizing enzyme
MTMKTIFDNINVEYAEYSYFKKLNTADQLQYLFEIYEEQTTDKKSVDLSAFFDTIHKELQEPESLDDEPISSNDRVDVLIDDDNIMIESNSLKAIRHISLKFIEAGYILSRDKSMEKMFHKDKQTKYLRIYRIIDQVSTICLN